MIKNCKVGQNCNIKESADLFGVEIGNNVKIDSFVYIEEGVKIGDDTRIRTHVFIPAGVLIGKRCFIASGVKFTNDKRPMVGDKHPKLQFTRVGDDVSIGANAVILPDLFIGDGALIGAGAVISKDVQPHTIIYTKRENVEKIHERQGDRL